MIWLHSKGIQHGDIQPKNIMYSKTHDKFFIIDFGLAEWLQTPRIDYERFADIPNRAKVGKILSEFSVSYLLTYIDGNSLTALKNKIEEKNKKRHNVDMDTEIAQFAALNYIKKTGVFANDAENKLFGD
jgi:tRNA A-37 threonylcarbamoyl transferase component Bud32